MFEYGFLLAAVAEPASSLLVSLFVIFAAAKLAAELFERLGQPAVVGEIVVGVVIGPHALGWVAPTETTSALAEIGVILLLFTVGLEVNATSILKVGARAFMVAVGGVVLPFVAGWGFMAWRGAPTVEGVFLGATMVATSVGITARVLAAMGLLNVRASQIILGAAVIDDILGLMVLSGVTSLASGKIDLLQIGLTVGLSTAFTLFMVFIGARIAKRAKPAVEKLKIGHGYFVSGMILCLGLSLLATEAGVAPIIGAFLAGMALAEVVDGTGMHDQVAAVTEFLVPFFMVSIGLQLDLTVFRDMSTVYLALAVTGIAVATKVIGCGLASWDLGRREALQIGVGMVPRGEVGMIVAQVGLSLGVLTGQLYGVVVFMAVTTTLIAPPFLARLFIGSHPVTGAASEGVTDVPETDLW